MSNILMPKATAVWLIENTILTFEQIGEFCNMHELEVQAIADGETTPIIGVNPIQNGQLTMEEIKKCEANPKVHLKMEKETQTFIEKSKKVKNKYTPMSQRRNRPDAIAWILKNHPEVSDAQISKLLRTTKNTINAIRNKTHKDIAEIRPRNPLTLGMCSDTDLFKAIELGEKRAKREAEKKEKELKKQQKDQ